MKNEIIEILKKKLSGIIEKFDETQIINNNELFYEKLLNQSLFEKERIIVINRCSEKIYGVIENITERVFSDTKIILNANSLEKKSKLRNLFEKSTKLIIIPTYKDTSISLMEIAKKLRAHLKLSNH